MMSNPPSKHGVSPAGEIEPRKEQIKETVLLLTNVPGINMNLSLNIFRLGLRITAYQKYGIRQSGDSCLSVRPMRKILGTWGHV